MRRREQRRRWQYLVVPVLLAAGMPVFGGGLLHPKRGKQADDGFRDNRVRYPSIYEGVTAQKFLPLSRKHPWSLPDQSLAAGFDTTIHCLVLRYNFQYETVDDPNTTGRGHMNLSPHPIPNDSNSATPADSIAYLDSVGHFIDPPPHDSVYFDRQMRALSTYWETVSHGKITLSWDIYPPGRDSVYELPHEMGYYGRCDFNEVVQGLEDYFRDCIQLADTVQRLDPNHPDIDFSQYQSIFLVHAGADAQNDIGFPPTCGDLFTGFIRFGQPIPVDNGAELASTALLMPETASQDNRATALNAVMAHEFGHQLGLVDLYSTRTFLSQLGDFALMDDNGFGTGVDFGWPAGNSFGTIPVYPSAWSRAFLGFEPVVDFRQGQDIRVVAADVVSQGIQVARLPISETEYYLIENRMRDLDGVEAGVQFDTLTNVILGPARRDVDSLGNDVIVQNGEYDFLCPGDGLLIYHIDENVAALDYDNDGLDNFSDNQLQWDKDRRFVSLVEADGLVNFGGNFRSGFGSERDMYRDDRNNSFTPNTNPPAIDNSGNNTHIYVTDIRRAPDTTVPKQPLMDSVILFSVDNDRLAENFPVRCGVPRVGLSPIADDLDGDGTDEVIVASGDLLSVFTTSGENFIQKVDPCVTCPVYLDTFITSINRLNSFQPVKGYPVPLFWKFPAVITVGPVSGSFAGDSTRYVVCGYSMDTAGFNSEILFLKATDLDNDGRADPVTAMAVSGIPIGMTFGKILWVVTATGRVYKQTSIGAPPSSAAFVLPYSLTNGVARLGERLVVMSDDTTVAGGQTVFSVMSDTVYEYTIDGQYQLGPTVADMNRDGTPELIAFSADGRGLYLSVDTSTAVPSFSVAAARATGYRVTVSPTVGDIDLDGLPDVVIGGRDTIYAFNGSLLLKTDFPREVDDRHIDADVFSAITIADIQSGGRPEMIAATSAGNVYAWGDEPAYGFPLNSGEQTAPFANGSMLVFNDSLGGKLGYLGGDGWFYAWNVDADSVTDFWPMARADVGASNTFDQSKLGAMTTLSEAFPPQRFYNYPNPVTGGSTVIRYYLGRPATRVTLRIYDLSGQRVAQLAGTTLGGTDNETVWQCGSVSPGVYRCVIDVDFGNEQRNASTDIAVIR